MYFIERVHVGGLLPVGLPQPAGKLGSATATQFSVTDAADVPESQAAHEPALVALAPVSRAVLSVCLPQLVCATQLLAPDAA